MSTAEIEAALVTKNHEAHDLEIDNRQLKAQVEQLKAEVDRLKDDVECYKKLHAWLQDQLAQKVVLPERSNERGSDGKLTYEAVAHNRCLDEVASLNGAKP